MSADALAQLRDRIRESWADTTLVRITLGSYQGPDRTLKRLQVRPVTLKAGRRLSLVWQHQTQDITKNYEFEPGLELLMALLSADFATGHLATTQANWQFERRSVGETRLHRSKPTEGQRAVIIEHDRPKSRAVDRHADWLQRLGVVGSQGEVRRGMEAKYRQIHRFIELLSPVIQSTEESSSLPIRVVDMGCGKGYLTFALYFHLIEHFPEREIRLSGLEVRSELVEAANALALDCGASGLTFHQSTIAEWPSEPVTGMVALHACDTATDDALAWGIRANATWLVCSPCCHRELRPRIIAPEALAPAFRHGILVERQAEFVTDALRATLLEWAGYQSRVLEFISPEHTAKNLLITGVRRPDFGLNPEKAVSVHRLAALYGIQQQHLARLLHFPWPAREASLP